MNEQLWEVMQFTVTEILIKVHPNLYSIKLIILPVSKHNLGHNLKRRLVDLDWDFVRPLLLRLSLNIWVI